MKRMVLGLALAMGLSSISMIAAADEAKPAPAATAKPNAKAKAKPAAKSDKKVEAQKAQGQKAPMKTGGGAAASNKMEGGE